MGVCTVSCHIPPAAFHLPHSTCLLRLNAARPQIPPYAAWPDEEASNEAIARRQADMAASLLDAPADLLEGPVQAAHTYMDMRYRHVAASDWTREGTTCPPAMGYSFAAGTTDGPGAFDFKQGDTHGTPFWRMVTRFITQPSPRLVECQAPKPILLATGEMDSPYPWYSFPFFFRSQRRRMGPVPDRVS